MADSNSSSRINLQEIMNINQETSGCFPIWSHITYCREKPFNLGKQIGSRNIYVQCKCNIFNWVNKLANCLICYSIAQHELRKIS